jgi:CRISPR-associated protein Csx17
MNSLHLTGCSPTPLASYLKALGILRLVSEQADPAARGAWENEFFVLYTTLTEDELSDFFLKNYAPSPLVDPWNRGSGFLSSKDKAAKNLSQVEKSKSLRFKPFQDGIAAARAIPLLAQLTAVADIKKDFDRLKPKFIQQCRLNWRGPILEWLDAALIIQSDLSPKFPALLGSGGNDGRLDFTDNFRQRFADLFDIDTGKPNKKAGPLLRSALFAAPAQGAGKGAIGQYSPGAAGGANSTNGLDGKSHVNPWDFILFLEGAVLFASAATRRLNNSASASAPFALYAQAAGHLSSSSGDKAARGEQWMPLWAQPATLGEVRSLLSEGRAQLGRTATREPLDMARAIARLGVARGISAFERYGYLERNGQANFAVPLGRWQVSAQPRQDLLADLDNYLARLHREAKSDHASNTLATAARNLDDAILAAAANGSLPLNWQNILLALADCESIIAKIPPDKNKVGILTGLTPGWIDAADDGTPEFRLALAFGTQSDIRRHFLPLNKFGNRLDATAASSVVCFGRTFVADAIAFIDRRFVEAGKDASRAFSQFSHRPAALADISAFLSGALDEPRILALARAFMAFGPRALPGAVPRAHAEYESAEDNFALFRLALRPDIFRRLASGDIASAARSAAQHLRSRGIVPPISLAVGDARRLAASLAFPISRAAQDVLAAAFTVTSTKE